MWFNCECLFVYCAMQLTVNQSRVYSDSPKYDKLQSPGMDRWMDGRMDGFHSTVQYSAWFAIAVHNSVYYQSESYLLAKDVKTYKEFISGKMCI